jgi:hypothetical protein
VTVTRPPQGLSISLLAVADAGDFDSVFLAEIEEEAIVAATKPEAVQRMLQLFHIAGAGFQIAGD